MSIFEKKQDDHGIANIRHIELTNRVDFLYEMINDKKFSKDEEKIIRNIIRDLTDLDFIIRGIYLLKVGSGFIK